MSQFLLGLIKSRYNPPVRQPAVWALSWPLVHAAFGRRLPAPPSCYESPKILTGAERIEKSRFKWVHMAAFCPKTLKLGTFPCDSDPHSFHTDADPALNSMRIRIRILGANRKWINTDPDPGTYHPSSVIRIRIRFIRMRIQP